jgi:hypothetical protein
MNMNDASLDLSLDDVQRRLAIGPYDPIVSEIRAFRAQRAKEANYDIQKMVDMAKRGSDAALQKYRASQAVALKVAA